MQTGKGMEPIGMVGRSRGSLPKRCAPIDLTEFADQELAKRCDNTADSVCS